jgi:uncharacterized membrane protein
VGRTDLIAAPLVSVPTMRAHKMFTAAIRASGFLAAAAGSALITWGSLAYFSADELAPFVIEKLPLPNEELWLGALQVHVVAASFALPACLLLLSRKVLRRFPRFHRWLGRLAATAIVFALAPSGFYLSFFAKAGFWSTVGFQLTGLITLVSMVLAVTTARKKDFVAHRRWTLHMFAQLSVAVSSRAMLFGLDAFNVEPDLAYLVALWVPVVGSALCVELLVPRSFKRLTSWRNHEAPSDPGLAARSYAGLRGGARA